MKNFIKNHIEQIRNTWYLLTGQLWFTPLVICLFILAVLGTLTFVEYNYSLVGDIKDKVFKSRLENAKDIALALMSSMMTMTTMVISITIVVISLASSQMGPRLIKAFIANDKTQIYFGLFFGSVVCAFYFVRITHSQTFTESNLPALTISFCVLYCFSTLFLLLFYVNHVAKSCMADTIVTEVGNKLIKDIFRLIKNQPYLKDVDNKKNSEDVLVPKEFKYEVTTLKSNKEGYLQYLNFNFLSAHLQGANAFLYFKVMVGEHILKGQTIATLYTTKKKDAESDEVKDLVENMHNYIDIGESRTQTQDLEYAIRHLVEIGLRALSPGINDPYTANKVIDQLTASLSLLMSEGYRQSFVIDKDGEPRIGGNAHSLEQLFGSSFNQIREAAFERLDINLYLLDKLQRLAEFASNKKQWKILEMQLAGIKECTNLQKTKDSQRFLKNKIEQTEEIFASLKK